MDADNNSHSQMEDPNDAFGGATGNTHRPAPSSDSTFNLAPGQNSNIVSFSSSSNNHHGNARARRPNNVNPSTGSLKTEPNAANANTEDVWNVPSNSANVNQPFSQPISARGSQRWTPAPVPNNEYMQAYGLPEGLAHGLPSFPHSQGLSSSFDLGPAMGGMPNLDSSSSSSCRVNGSSPNTVFGSFSSSIGPPDMMDMDMREECFHSPSVFPSEVPLCHNTGPIPPAFLSRSPVHDFPANAGGVFPEAETVSPKMLHLNTAPMFPSSSSSESLPNPFRMDSDSEVLSSAAAVDEEDILPTSAWQARREANNKANTVGRKQLPDKAPHPKSNASSSSSGSKRRRGGDATGEKSLAPSSKKTKSKSKATSQSSHSQVKYQPSSHHSHRTQNAAGFDSSGSARHKTIPSSSKATPTAGGASSSAAAMGPSIATHPRSERDDYLVRSKRSGMTYKEIRKAGGFTEAESTLRGRFRTLTKPKEARVRKPEFQEIDVSFFLLHTTCPWLLSTQELTHSPPIPQDKLLKRGVVKLTKDVGEITRDNVPWKQVSEYMAGHGGSYHFGYTTVRKRWEYLMTTSEEQVRQDRLAHKFQQ